MFKHLIHRASLITVALSLIMNQFACAAESTHDQREMFEKGKPSYLCVYLANALELDTPVLEAIFFHNDKLRESEKDHRILSAINPILSEVIRDTWVINYHQYINRSFLSSLGILLSSMMILPMTSYSWLNQMTMCNKIYGPNFSDPWCLFVKFQGYEVTPIVLVGTWAFGYIKFRRSYFQSRNNIFVRAGLPANEINIKVLKKLLNEETRNSPLKEKQE